MNKQILLPIESCLPAFRLTQKRRLSHVLSCLYAAFHAYVRFSLVLLMRFTLFLAIFTMSEMEVK